jgi:hypothetical protein
MELPGQIDSRVNDVARVPEAHAAIPSSAVFQTEAKFAALNTFGDLMASPNVDVLNGARVMAVEMAAGVASGRAFSQKAGKERATRADLVVIGVTFIRISF